MKSKTLLARLSAFLNADEAAQQREVKAVKKILKALKDKETALKRRLQESADEEERAALQTKLEVLYAQRRKGIERVKALKTASAQ